MATIITCQSVQKGVHPIEVSLEHFTDTDLVTTKLEIDNFLLSGMQTSEAIAQVLINATERAPEANPSDIWHHVIYRHLLEKQWNDAKWKRVSGFAMERFIEKVYTARLASDIRIRRFSKKEADAFLKRIGSQISSTRIDLFLEGYHDNKWHVFGIGHAKSSLGERIQDDVPASEAFMKMGYVSIMITMDAKSYPPPHGNCVNYGELGGRSVGVDKHRIKREYIEKHGLFDALFSFNLRTPSSPEITPSTKKIYALPLFGTQPDSFVSFLRQKWLAWNATRVMTTLAEGNTIITPKSIIYAE